MSFFQSIREDFKGRFQDDYKKVKWILIIQYSFITIFLTLNHLSISSIIYNYKSIWRFKEQFFYLFPFFLIASSILSIVTDKKYQMHKKLKGSLFSKRIVQPFFISLLALYIGSLFIFSPFVEPTIDQAVQAFGKEIKVPTKIPFQVKETYGDINFRYNQLYLYINPN